MTSINDLPNETLGRILSCGIHNYPRCPTFSFILDVWRSDEPGPLKDLPKQILLETIGSYAIEDYTLDFASRMISFEMVSKQWKECARGHSASQAWEFACQQTFPGSTAQTREDYIFLKSSVAQSAALTITRALRGFINRHGRIHSGVTVNELIRILGIVN